MSYSDVTERHTHRWRAVYVYGSRGVDRKLIRVGSLCDRCDAYDPDGTADRPPTGMLSVTEVAERVGITPALVRQHVSRGLLRVTKSGQRSWISEDDLSGYMEARDG